MLARRKYVVQKSFRIDQRLEYDMYLISELTNKSQNELVNVAIEEFLKDNGKWFLENAIVEQFSPIFEYTGEEYDPVFKMGGVEVVMNERDNGYYKIHISIKRGIESMDDEYEKCISVSDEDAEEQLKSHLRYVGSYIDEESEDSKQYLKKRTDYSDYIPVKKRKKAK